MNDFCYKVNLKLSIEEILSMAVSSSLCLSITIKFVSPVITFPFSISSDSRSNFRPVTILFCKYLSIWIGSCIFRDAISSMQIFVNVLICLCACCLLAKTWLIIQTAWSLKGHHHLFQMILIRDVFQMQNGCFLLQVTVLEKFQMMNDCFLL